MIKTVSFLFALCFFCHEFSFAVKPPKVKKGLVLYGKIMDSVNNEFLPGVKITCQNDEKVVYSDLNGNFFIYLDNPSSENIILEFHQVGYSTKSLNLKAFQASFSNLQVDLESKSDFQM